MRSGEAMSSASTHRHDYVYIKTSPTRDVMCASRVQSKKWRLQWLRWNCCLFMEDAPEPLMSRMSLVIHGGVGDTLIGQCGGLQGGLGFYCIAVDIAHALGPKEPNATIPNDKIYLVQVGDAYTEYPCRSALGLLPRGRWNQVFRPM